MRDRSLAAFRAPALGMQGHLDEARVHPGENLRRARGARRGGPARPIVVADRGPARAERRRRSRGVRRWGRRVAACSRRQASADGSRPARAISPRRCTRSAGSTKRTPGPPGGRARRQRRCDHPDAVAAGPREGARPSRRAGEAERLAREAVAIGGETHLTESIGDAHADLAEILELAGRPRRRTGRARGGACAVRAQGSRAQREPHAGAARHPSLGCRS